jgi:YesN/AraC family two-component response regulator
MQPQEITVLVVDDRPSLRHACSRVVQAYLQMPWANIGEAENGKQAWSKLEEQVYNVVLTDTVIKSDERFADTKVIVISGRDYIKQAQAAGADAFFFKPVDSLKLIAKIRELLGMPPDPSLENDVSPAP